MNVAQSYGFVGDFARLRRWLFVAVYIVLINMMHLCFFVAAFYYLYAIIVCICNILYRGEKL